MRKFRTSVIFKHIINLIYVLLLFIPYREVYTPLHSDEWTKGYVYTDDALLFFAPFGILWVLFQNIKDSRFKVFAKWSCLVITALYFIGILPTLIYLMQDYIPKIGSLLLLGLFPLVILMLFFEKREREEMEKELEGILDA